MRINKKMAIIVLSLLLSTAFIAPPPAHGEEEGPGPLYVSIFWVGQSETDCLIRDTLMTDTLEQCRVEYERAEKEIEKMVARKNDGGGKWQWGAIAICQEFTDPQAYSEELEKLRKKCSGK